jgi:hypothetical protein
MRLPIGSRLVKSTYCAVEGYLIFCESACYLLPLFTQVRGRGVLETSAYAGSRTNSANEEGIPAWLGKAPTFHREWIESVCLCRGTLRAH